LSPTAMDEDTPRAPTERTPLLSAAGELEIVNALRDRAEERRLSLANRRMSKGSGRRPSGARRASTRRRSFVYTGDSTDGQTVSVIGRPCAWPGLVAVLS
jgi:hypothetical protein